MKKIAALAVLASGLLGGCGLFTPSDGPDPTQPRITFELGPDFAAKPQFSVTPRELVFKQRGEVKITWSLDKGSNLKFVKNFGVDIVGEVKDVIAVRAISPQPLASAPLAEGSKVFDRQFLAAKQDQIVDCKVSEDRLAVTCTNRHTRAGIFKYALRLTDDASGNEFILDPRINNW